MAEPQRDESKVSSAGLIVLAALAMSGIIVSQIPLKSSRPPAREQAAVSSVGEQQAQARLWQDPFVAVREHEQLEEGKDRKHEHPLHNLAEEVAAQIAALREKENLAVLVVLTDGSAYEENTEQRIRQRVALGSALAVACFVPTDSEHIGFFTMPPQPLKKNVSPETYASLANLRVPFEWYRSSTLRNCWEPEAQIDRIKYPKVLVLWLKDDAFSTKPLSKLSIFLESATVRSKESPPVNASATNN
jgi:hypothetical protein